MRILVEILHPAHVHFFKHAIWTWQERGDEVLVLSREKECANDLLRAYGIPFKSISSLKPSKTALVTEMLVRDWRMWSQAKKFKPDVLVGIMGVTIAQVGKLIGKPAIVFYDTENATLTNRLIYPLAHSVCTPNCYQGKVSGQHVTYAGYHELAYLHPDRFKVDPDILLEAGLDSHENYFITRFVSWQASHDVGEAGLALNFKRSVVERLRHHGRVLVTSEGELPEDLKPYQFNLPPENMHHVLAGASMIVGESATMASEAAVLGVPAVYVSDTGRGYTDEQEAQYGLVFNYTTSEAAQALERIDALLRLDDRDGHFKLRQEQLLKDKIDTTTWILRYVDSVVKPTSS